MNNFNRTMLLFSLIICLTISMAPGIAMAKSKNLCYQVTVTNMTRGQVFTPVLVATHKSRFNLFTIGEPVIDELAQLAEGGDTVPLADYLQTMVNTIGSIAVSEGGPFAAGESVEVQVPAYKGYNRLSLASMLAITNDGFIALKGVSARNRTYFSPVYDAGSETNDELVENIPGPGGEGYNPDDEGEGFVHIHAGIHGIGDLPAYEDLDWRNPAAKITTRLVKCRDE